MTEPLREGLAPIVGEGARVLILGSFPSERSLQTGEYYANRRNQFWRLLGSVFGFDPDASYPERIDAVRDHGVALWDVVASCRRVGSMDAQIDRTSLTLNDIGALVRQHSGIARVFVNGSTAFELYEASARPGDITLPATRLVSSSGAAAIPLSDKLIGWRAVARG